MAELTKFPESGVCWNPNGALLQYLKKRSTTKHGVAITTKELMEAGGLAWDKVSLWTVKYRSANTEYRLEELIRHMRIDISDEVGQYPLTPQECYPPEKWCVKVDDKNYPLLTAFMLKHRSEWKDYRDEWELANGNFFHYPPFHPSCHSSDKFEPGYLLVTTQQIMHVLTNKNDVQELTEFPKAGYCPNPSTRVLDYLNANYRKMHSSGAEGVKWVTSVYQFWSSSGKEPNSGNIETYTSEQLEKILNLKQQKNGRQEKTSSVPCTGVSALKVPRFNLAIRAGDPIRADTIRCPKSKIRLGGLNSSDKPNFS